MSILHDVSIDSSSVLSRINSFPFARVVQRNTLLLHSFKSFDRNVGKFVGNSLEIRWNVINCNRTSLNVGVA